MEATEVGAEPDAQRQEVLRLRRMLCDLMAEVYLSPGIAGSASLCAAYQRAQTQYVESLDAGEAAVIEQAVLKRLRESGILAGRISREDLASAVRSVGADLLELVAAKP